MKNQQIFGASALVMIRFSGSFESLVDKLREALSLPDMDIEVDEYPPHGNIASVEMLGMNLWLKPADGTAGEFELLLRTRNVAREIAHGRVYDISRWLKQLLTIYEIDASVIEGEDSAA